MADATAGRVVTAATRGTVPIRIADNAHDIELRTAAIVPSFSFVAIGLRMTPAKGSRAGNSQGGSNALTFNPDHLTGADQLFQDFVSSDV